jgi:hypothetical protein
METMRKVRQAKTIIGYAVAGDGGPTTQYTWETRPLSYIWGNISNQVSLNVGANTFTLQPGWWDMDITCNLGGAGNALLRLIDVNTGIAPVQGMVCSAGTSITSPGTAFLKFIQNITTPKTLRLEQWSTHTIANGMGSGIAGVATHHTYIQLEMLKEPS